MKCPLSHTDHCHNIIERILQKLSFPVILICLIFLTACSTQFYVLDMDVPQRQYPEKHLFMLPVQYNLYTSPYLFIEAYKVSVSKTHIYYSDTPFGDVDQMIEIDKISHFTYSQKAPGTLLGAISGLLIGNMILNIHDGQLPHATDNITSNYALFAMSLGAVSGTMIGAQQVVFVHTHYTGDLARRRINGQQWIVD